jgi:hypothetical protein
MPTLIDDDLLQLGFTLDRAGNKLNRVVLERFHNWAGLLVDLTKDSTEAYNDRASELFLRHQVVSDLFFDLLRRFEFIEDNGGHDVESPRILNNYQIGVCCCHDLVAYASHEPEIYLPDYDTDQRSEEEAKEPDTGDPKREF